jgi:uncharacterized protein YjlB
MTKGPSAESQGLAPEPHPQIFMFEDDGFIPNHPRWPMIVYKDVVRVSRNLDPASFFEELFDGHGWGSSWRDGIYAYAHYHSGTHEVLGIARGTAEVQFGGVKGHILSLMEGDVAILPAGTGHRRLKASADLLVVGAYPPGGSYDECRSEKDRDRALPLIERIPRPRQDPVYGEGGPLIHVWRE